MSHQLIIPTHLIAPLAITAAKLSTADICELNQAFLQWQQQQFVDEDCNSFSFSLQTKFTPLATSRIHWCY